MTYLFSWNIILREYENGKRASTIRYYNEDKIRIPIFGVVMMVNNIINIDIDFFVNLVLSQQETENVLIEQLIAW